MLKIKMDEAAGKTIKAYTYNNEENQLLIAFMDQTYVLLEGICYPGGDLSIREADELKPLDFGESRLVNAGVLTKQQADDLRSAYKQRQKEYSQERDRQLYEKLKRKFEIQQ